ncbi:MAG: endonuclease III domain-containing protein [Syntrophomonadaceae bacterium]|nr:endonuclease III domain-containing protein [Syntrophomonadaceae bacterium]
MLIKDILLNIYECLYQHFGPRGWWPADTPWEVAVGAILTQNVAWRNVEQAIANLKEANLLGLQEMQLATEEEIASRIRPTRYYNTKARKLKVFVNYLTEQYAGELSNLWHQPLEKLRAELLNLWGLGPETVDSILLYAGNQPIFVVDAYTRRIFSRLGLLPEKVTYAEMQRFFMDHLPVEVELYNEYHALIDALGNQVCLNRAPKCHLCPLAEQCQGKTLV